MRQLLFFRYCLALFILLPLDCFAGETEVWEKLNSPDIRVRSHARLFIQKQPIEAWLNRAMLEHRPWAALESIRAVCHSLPVDRAHAIRPHLCEQLMTLPLEQMSDEQLLYALEITTLVFNQLAPATEDEILQMRDLWTAISEKTNTAALVGRRIAQLLDFFSKLQKSQKR